MEIIVYVLVCLLLCTTCFLLWKLYKLKKDIYTYSSNMDSYMDDILSDYPLREVSYGEDSLEGKMYSKLLRISLLSRKKNELLTQEKEEVKALIADISHQTKTPIANIKLYLEILANEERNHSNPEFIHNMQHQVNKLDFLLQNLVKLSRLDTGIIQLMKNDTLLIDTLADAISNTIPKANQKHISIQVDCDTHISLLHDRKWCAEAIYNIVDNAIKYSKEYTTVSISVNVQEIYVRIDIKDEGKGIALHHQGNIFTRFYREPQVHDEEGVGIGLYLSRKIITMQQGYIEVSSQIEKGSTFSIYLPR